MNPDLEAISEYRSLFYGAKLPKPKDSGIYAGILILFLIHAVLVLIQPFPSAVPDELAYLTGQVPSIYATLGYRAGMVFMAGCYALCIIPLARITKSWKAAFILCLYPPFFMWSQFAMVEGAFWLCAFATAVYWENKVDSWFFAIASAVVKPLGFALVCLKVALARPFWGMLGGLACLIALPFLTRGMELVPASNWLPNILFYSAYGFAAGGLVLPLLAVVRIARGDLGKDGPNDKAVLMTAAAVSIATLGTGLFIPTDFIDGRYISPAGILLAALGWKYTHDWRIIGVPVLFTPLIIYGTFMYPYYLFGLCLTEMSGRCEMFHQLISLFG